MKRKKSSEMSWGERASAKSPKHWVKVRKIALGIVTVAGVIASIGTGVGLPAAVVTIATAITTAAGSTAFTSLFTVDPDQAPQVSED